MQLRPYQQEAINSILGADKQALAVLPVGAGKTVILSHVIVALGRKTLIVGHTRDILLQIRATLLMIDPSLNIGLIGFGEESYGDITIASIQSLRRGKLAKLPAIEAVCVDECHHAHADSYRLVLDTFPEAFRFGVTATPDRLDKASIVPLFGHPVYSISMRELIKQGYLVDIRAWSVHTDISLDGVRVQASEYNVRELSRVCDRTDRNERVVEAYREHANGKLAICFAIDKEHSRHQSEAFNKAGIPSEFITCDTSIADRDTILERFRTGVTLVLVNCQIFTEGADIPQVVAIIQARPTMSRGLYTQMIGRGVRTYQGKSECILIDITDNSAKHRLTPPCLNDLGLKHSMTAMEVLREEEEEAEKIERAKKEVALLEGIMYRVIDVFTGDVPTWDASEDGSFSCTSGLFLFRADCTSPNKYELVIRRKRRDYTLFRGATCSKKQAVQMFTHFLSIIQEGNESLIDPSKPWASDPASMAQRNALKGMGFDTSGISTKFDASMYFAYHKAKRLPIRLEEIAC